MDCAYHEGPFLDVAELQSHISEISGESASALICFNDLLLLPGAVNHLMQAVQERHILLFWVNNLSIVRTCGMADFSSNFERVGERIGEMTVRLLRDGVPIGDMPFAEDPGERFSLNLRRCKELRINPSEEVVRKFHSIVE
jgi:ABC-type uncharacterized transport system substrate-binding protein